MVDGGSCVIPGPDDGFVPIDSVNPENHYIQIGPIFPYYHIDLLNQKDIYQDVLPILER